MDVLMPQLGETVAEGKVTKWFKSAGDAIKPGDNLFEIETDKVSMEVPSTTAGVLGRNPRAGGRGGAGRRRRRGDRGRQRSGEPRQRLAPAAAKAPSKPAPRRFGGGTGVHAAHRRRERRSRSIRSSRCARPRATMARRGCRAATRHAAGAAAGGRGRHRPRPDLAVRSARPHRRARRRDGRARTRPNGARLLAEGPTAEQIKALYRDVPFTEVPLDGMRKTIAARLQQAKQTIPHFYLTADVEIGRLLKLREEVNAAAPKDTDGNPAFKLSVNDLVIKAWAAALQRVPAANAVWAEDRILRFVHADIGVAVAIEGGLITPVIRQAETKSLSAISGEMKDAGRARARARSSSRTNTRAARPRSPISACTACANSPPSSIRRRRPSSRSAPRAGRRSRRTDGGVAFASIMSVTLSCDHRVVDGALGAELLAAFRGFVEQPVTMLV